MKYIFLSILLSFAAGAIGQGRGGQYISIETARKEYVKLANQPYHLFAETRENPIHWNDSLRVSWLQNDFTDKSFELEARPGEYFVYQIGVWAANSDANDLKIMFSDLKSKSGKTIASKQVSCFNAGGSNYLGKPFSKKINIGNGKVQALWIGVDLSGAVNGIYDGTATVSVNNTKKRIKIQLTVHG
jgi:hypothetical protein